MGARLSDDQLVRMVEVLRSAGVVYATLFGSAARGLLRAESDIDIAAAAAQPMSSQTRRELIASLADVINRPVDLIDLRTARGVVFAKALQGEELFCDSARAKGQARARRVGLIEEDLAFGRRAFAAAQPRMFR